SAQNECGSAQDCCEGTSSVGSGKAGKGHNGVEARPIKDNHPGLPVKSERRKIFEPRYPSLSRACSQNRLVPIPTISSQPTAERTLRSAQISLGETNHGSRSENRQDSRP